MQRDDFLASVKRELAKRVANRCSLCGKATSAPRLGPSGAVDIGVASHITAASPGGPRYDTSISEKERKSAANGIWLCQSCGKLIDDDVQGYPADNLRERKSRAEEEARREVHPQSRSSDDLFVEAERRMPKLIGEMRADALGDTKDLIHEFFLPRTKNVAWVPTGERFYYAQADHPDLLLQGEWLAGKRLVEQVDTWPGNVPVYRMQPKFVRWLRSPTGDAPPSALEFQGVQIGRIDLNLQLGPMGTAIGSNYVPPEHAALPPTIQRCPIEMAWLHVRNKGTRPTDDAKEVMAVISLHRSDGSPLYDFQGRWRESRERREVSSYRDVSDRVTIPAARRSTLDVAFKYEGETPAYCVNTESTELAPDWRYKPWELLGEYLVKVAVSGDNVSTLIGWFKLTNPGSAPLLLEPSLGPAGADGSSISVTPGIIPDAQIGYSGWTSRAHDATAPQRQHSPVEEIERSRRRDQQIASAPILKVGKPSFTYSSQEMALEVENASPASIALAPRLRVRASKDPVGPPSWDPPLGATELLMTLPDALAPGQRASFRGILGDFVEATKPTSEIPLWPEQLICDVLTTGIFGQRVLQRYEWVPRGPGGAYFRQLFVEVIPNVEGTLPERIPS
jgi:hypothetical protein